MPELIKDIKVKLKQEDIIDSVRMKIKQSYPQLDCKKINLLIEPEGNIIAECEMDIKPVTNIRGFGNAEDY